MKARTIILCLLLLTSMATLAHEETDRFLPLVQEGKRWDTQVDTYWWDGSGRQTMYNYHYTMEGDTLIGGVTWKKVFSSRIGNESRQWGGEEQSYYAAIREENKKVYAIKDGCDKQRLIYDFGMEVGDTVRCGDEAGDYFFQCILGPNDEWTTEYVQSWFTVTHIDTIEVDGQLLRRFTIRTFTHSSIKEYQDCDMVWVEGIGSLAGLFQPWYFQNIGTTRCSIGGNTFFEGEIDNTEHGVEAIENITLLPATDTPIYDLQGRRLSAKPVRGMYIQDGRKYVVK